MYKGLFISLFSTLQNFAVKKSVSSCFEYYGCCRLGAPRQVLNTEHAVLERTCVWRLCGSHEMGGSLQGPVSSKERKKKEMGGKSCGLEEPVMGGQGCHRVSAGGRSTISKLRFELASKWRRAWDFVLSREPQ